MQRITLRWIWVSHAQRLYGNDMMYGDPSSMLSHIQSEFESRIKWDYAKTQRLYVKAQLKGNKKRPCIVFKLKWGGIVKFDKEGKVMSLVLTTRPEQPLHAI